MLFLMFQQLQRERNLILKVVLAISWELVIISPFWAIPEKSKQGWGVEDILF